GIYKGPWNTYGATRIGDTSKIINQDVKITSYAKTASGEYYQFQTMDGSVTAWADIRNFQLIANIKKKQNEIVTAINERDINSDSSEEVKSTINSDTAIKTPITSKDEELKKSTADSRDVIEHSMENE
ncbi:GW dipeptide domain-containing protein, partial [Enterococcus gallinarum]